MDTVHRWSKYSEHTEHIESIDLVLRALAVRVLAVRAVPTDGILLAFAVPLKYSQYTQYAVHEPEILRMHEVLAVVFFENSSLFSQVLGDGASLEYCTNSKALCYQVQCSSILFTEYRYSYHTYGVHSRTAAS